MIYRLTEDHGGLLEGSYVSEEKFRSIYYLDKPFFEPIQDYEVRDMINYENEVYCIENGIDGLLFYNEKELNSFLNKIHECSGN